MCTVDYKCPECNFIEEDVAVTAGSIPKTKKCIKCGGRANRTYSKNIHISPYFKAVRNETDEKKIYKEVD